MSVWKGFLQSDFMIKLRNWEYWPFGILQFPLFFYYPWLSLRAGSFTFFSASNPGILMGGMFGESKFDVMQMVPDEFKPKTVLVRQNTDPEKLTELLGQNNLNFPLIFKPDIGERGFMVRKIHDITEATSYIREMKNDFIMQEYVSLPMEFGVFYARIPGSEKGKVTSVVMKEMLFVEGDGKSTLRELIFKKERAKLQWPSLKILFRDQLDKVLASGTKTEIVSIGNHCLGTKFINANHLITEKMSDSFDRISKSIPGFFFGRYDLRCNTIQDLENGNISIMELNGCGAEPAHIYDPEFSFWEAVSVLIQHWKTIFTIARLNKKTGVNYLPLKDAIRHYHNFKEKTQ
jgi:hypothetical protein